jgi:glycosyltransferase involved in cell wall biosynthesis
MKILVVHNQYQQRGGEDSVREFENRLLRERGHQVDTFLETNQRVGEIGPVRTAARAIWSSEGYRRLRRAMRSTRYDVMHVHNTFPLISPAAYYAARHEGVPVVQTLHNYRLICPSAVFFRQGRVCEDCLGKPVPWPGVIHRCYRGSRAATAAVAAMLTTHRMLGTWSQMVDVYVALTEFERQKFVQAGLPGPKIVLKPNAVDPDPGPGRHDGDFALFVGRLSAEKGVDTLLAAWRQLDRPIRLRMVGDGPLASSVQAAAAADGRIDWMGRVEPGRVAGVMKQARALILPSLWYEGFPMAIAEAFAVGLPIIASDIGSMKGLIEHGRLGVRFKPGDPTALAAAVVGLWDESSSLADMSRSCRQQYETLYSAEQNYQQLVDVYRRAVSGCRDDRA